MSTEIPYRAAGTFDGRSYVVRDADHDLLLEIERNQRFPYIVAPRQSGKSSLLIRTIKTLDPEEYTCAFIDIAPIVIESYREFWDEFLLGVAKSGKLSRDPLRRQDPEDTFRAWLEQQDTRLVVMVDEIDVLLAATFKEQFFSKIRTFFNNRAIDKTFSRLQFVLAGSARPSTLISDPKRSPFNVGIEVELEELSPDQLVALTAHLRSSGARVSPELPARIFHFTGGSVYLCQLILEHLWSVAIHGKSVIAPDDVDGIVDSIIEHAPRNVHFENLYRLLSGNRELLDSFRRLLDGEEIDDGARLELRLAGISNGLRPFRNELYRRVFSGDGRLSLTRHTRPRAGSRKSSDNGQLKPGDTLGGGTYRLMQKIGQGGFGAVWMALGQRDRRSVAIKVLHAHLAEDKKRRARFFRGARAMAQLDHPSIVHVIEPHGEEGGNYYFVMEYVEGYDFRDAVRRHFLPEDKVLPIIQQVGRALAHAHDRGLIHRDVKPSNILLDASGEPRLTDFDLVRMPDSATTNETQTGAVGSFIYTAPEVTREAKEADAAAALIA
ncbi:MAG: protein kinase, partial [Myxococcales bacterium]|nr:protein kinase [Myxococcales bacterium]